MAEAVAIGSELGRYRLTETVAEGGMAVVFLAEQLGTGREVALKVLRQELVASDDFRRRFLRESRYASSLEHPCIVRVFDTAETPDYLFLAMQYVPGGDLHQLLDKRVSLEPEEAMAVLAQVAGALDAAHEAGLLHRDVKPANVLLDDGTAGRCYLTDFGLSKDPLRDSHALTKPGSFVGTIEYTAPEEMLDRAVDGRADVYSLACVLYECLTGESPFAGRDDVEMMQAHIQDPPPRITKKRKHLPAELDAVIARGLAKEPGERYGSARELIEAAATAVGVRVEVPAAPEPTDLVLRVVEGRAVGEVIPLRDEVEFGRNALEAGKLKGDSQLSRRHARIARSADGPWTIQDLGSSNGTLVDGEQITGDVPLTVGANITMGNTTLVVERGAAPVQATPSLRLRIELDRAAGAGVLRVGDDELALVIEGGRVRPLR